MSRLITVVSIIVMAICLGNCHGLNEGYLDLSTGKEIEVVTDAKTGTIINKNTGTPLYILVDLIEEDTIYAKTGEVINGRVVNKGNNKYVYEKDAHLNPDSSMLVIDSVLASTDSIVAVTTDTKQKKTKDGDYKVKPKKNGDIKIKDGDQKIIIDGKTGQRTIKK